MLFIYPAKVEPDTEGRYLVTFRDLPEAATDGATLDEALAEARDCLDSVLMFRIKYGEDIAFPTKPRRGEVPITPDTTVALKAALHAAMRERHLTAADLSRALGIDHREARRILDPKHPTKLPRLQEALSAAGQRVAVDVSAA